MKKKTIIVILLSVVSALVISWVVWFGLNFKPGSYPYAEEYELNYSEEKLKTEINRFKADHPQYIVPKTKINNQETWDLTDGQSTEPNYWYGVYFYYKTENKILFTWTRPCGKNKTTFAFVSINDGLELGHWKMINRDFSKTENKAQIKLFEERILNPIKNQLAKQ